MFDQSWPKKWTNNFQNPMLQFPFPVKCDFAEAVKVPGEKQLLNFPIPLLPNTKMIILILDTSKPKKFFRLNSVSWVYENFRKKADFFFRSINFLLFLKETLHYFTIGFNHKWWTNPPRLKMQLCLSRSFTGWPTKYWWVWKFENSKSYRRSPNYLHKFYSVTKRM